VSFSFTKQVKKQETAASGKTTSSLFFIDKLLKYRKFLFRLSNQYQIANKMIMKLKIVLVTLLFVANLQSITLREAVEYIYNVEREILDIKVTAIQSPEEEQSILSQNQEKIDRATSCVKSWQEYICKSNLRQQFVDFEKTIKEQTEAKLEPSIQKWFQLSKEGFSKPHIDLTRQLVRAHLMADWLTGREPIS
jgi:hypothetical protein